MTYHKGVETLAVHQLQPGHVYLRHRRTAPLSGFQHNHPDRLARQPLSLEGFHKSPLRTVKHERDVVATVFGLDTHIPPGPVAEIVTTAECLKQFQGFGVALPRHTGIFTHRLADGQAAHTFVGHHRIGEKKHFRVIAADTHTRTTIEAALTR